MSDHDPRYWPILRDLIARTGPGPLLDVGANTGEFSALLSSEFPQRKIVAFEPDAGLCQGLRRRFAGMPAVQIENIALWRTGGRAEFHRHDNPATSSLLPRNATGRRYYAAGDRIAETVLVDTETLDTFSIRTACAHVAFLKLDTQGAELAIMEGARRLLGAAAIEVIYTEFFVVPHYEGAPLLPDLWIYLRGFGYHLYDFFRGPAGANGQLRFGDAIFVSPAFRQLHLDSHQQEP